MKPR
jgi:hypothetical protein